MQFEKGCVMRASRFSAMAACLLFIFSFASGGNKGIYGVASPSKTSGDDLYRPFLINNVFNYYGNNGDGSFNKYSADNEGFEFTKGTGKTCVFEEGVVWGGYHKGGTTPKVGGSVYRHGLSAGPIIQFGTATTDPVADDPTNPSNRIYRVRPDINPATPFASVQSKIASEETASISRYESYTDQNIYDQYINDWNQWPAAQGAPFVYGKDSNNVQRTSGPYNPKYDIPGRPGADQTLWYVANDCNASRTAFLAGSPVIGLEMRRTIWGYKRAGALGQTIFTSTVLINKSGAKIDTMYIAQWADPDVGDGGDDFVGCDTSRGLGYAYNGKPTDAVYGTAIPAVGFDIVQGPVVPGSSTDTAAFLSGKRAGYRNLPMSAFTFFTQGIVAFVDPVQGPGGDVQWYRLMQGMIASSGAQFIDPTTSLPTKFCLSGDPATQTGWRDGMFGLTPQDRRFSLAAGPFTMAAGDTQEMVVALTAGLGADYLSSITVLRSNDDKVQSAYNSMTGVGTVLGIAPPGKGIPVATELLQNYPNPFNPSTVIAYALGQRSNVNLTVFNGLGQEVATLVHEVQEAGRHEVRFTADGLASGIYFYMLTTGTAIATRKLVLIR
jgi:hypothetical protein